MLRTVNKVAEILALKKHSLDGEMEFRQIITNLII